MNVDPQQSTPIAFSSLFQASFVKALCAQSGAAWQAVATPVEDIPEEEAESFHAIFTLEGTLNGDLHLKLASSAAIALAGALLGQPSASMGDTERDALVEFIDGALPTFCEDAAALNSIFTASLTVTSDPVPEGLEALAFMLTGPEGVALKFQLLTAADLSGSLADQLAKAEQLLAQRFAAAESAAAESEPEAAPVFSPQHTPAQSTARAEGAGTPLTYQAGPTEPVNLELVLDVELKVTLRFGQRQLTLREVLELASGSVIELDRQVEEPVELLLEGKVIARGEAVVIDGNYGLRVTEVPQQFHPAMLR